jgi:hypothetical protein
VSLAKRVAGLAVIAGLASAVYLYVGDRHAAPTGRSASAVSDTTRDCPECRRMADRIEALQRNVAALNAQLSAQAARPPPRPLADTSKDSKPPTDMDDVQAVRAADAERRRAYMAGVAESFARERVDGVWANRASVRVNAALSGDEMLRGFAHNVECRSQTCRIEIADDGTGILSRRLPFVALGLADVLPSVSTEPADPASGHGGMVLYMSNQPPPVAAAK